MIIIKLLLFLVLLAASLYYVVHFVTVAHYSQLVITNRDQEIKITRDKYGIPTIIADSFEDSLFGLGFAQAQDRLWQIHFRRIASAGRLSSIFGDETLGMDKYLRNLGYLESSKRILESMDLRTRNLLQAYADGINQGRQSLIALPIEFQLLQTDFPEFTILDTLNFFKFYVLMASLDIQFETVRNEINQVYSKKLTAILGSIGPENMYHANFSMINDEELQEFSKNLYKHYSQRDIDEFKATIEDFEVMPQFAGSNAWVVHGNYTTTGYPILANDPHLQNSMPSPWYQAKLKLKDNYIQGATLVCVPIFAAGRSKLFSWGITILYSDTADFFKEKLQYQNGKLHYLFKQQWFPTREVIEQIDSKGVIHNVTYHFTGHGPIMDYQIDRLTGKGVPSSANLSLQALIHYDDFSVFNLITEFQLGNDFKAGIYNLRKIISPNVAMVFASKQDIGFVPMGKFIIREGNPNTHGLPKEGWTGENEWLGFLEEEKHPIIINPSKGYFATANDRLFNQNSDHYFTHAVCATSRGYRLYEVLKEQKKVSIQSMMKLQNDILDAYVRDTIKYVFLYLDKSNAKHNKFIDVINKWDFQLTGDSTRATLYMIFEDIYSQTIQGLTIYWQRGYLFDSFHFKNLENFSINEPWCLNLLNSTQPCLDNLQTSVEKAVDKWEKIQDKRWETQHQQFFPHGPFGGKLFGIFNKQIPYRGNRRTLATSWLEMKRDSFRGMAGANYRQIISMRPEDDGLYIIDTGTSGNLLSKHYDDQMQLWAKGEYISMNQEQVDTLILRPQKKKSDL